MKKIIILLAFCLIALSMEAQTYRYLKVETLHCSNHKWQELEWIEGETAYPQPKLTSANSNGMKVYGTSAASEAYLPYDGNPETHAWIGALAPPNSHYLTLDLGAGNEIDPEALRITKPTYSYFYKVRVWASNNDSDWELMLDSAGINSDGFAQMTFTLTEIQDLVAPSMPEDLALLSKTTNSITVGWSPSTDDRAVTGYEVFVDDELKVTTTQIACLIDGLTEGTTYNVYVKAFDVAGNRSEQSETLQVTTKTTDTEAPSDPSNLILTESTYDMLTFSWDPSTDNDELGGYLIYLNGLIAGIATGESFAIPGLESDSLYTIRVVARDASGNISSGFAEGTFLTGNDLPERMPIGTNFWNLSWGGSGNDPFTTGYQNVSGVNPWKQAFLDETKFYSHYRFMDWNITNGSPESHWNERTLKSDFQQNPMAYEWMIDLCNKQGVDLWITVPHLVVNSNGMEGDDNHYVKKLAILVKSGVDMLDIDLDDPVFENLDELTPTELIALGGLRRCDPLDPALKFYIEYSNETWNFGFTQADYCRVQGMALGLPGDQYGQGRRFHAWAALRIFEAVEDVFGPKNPRIMRIDAYQSVVASQITDHYSVYKSATYNPRNIFPDAFCPAPYFGHSVNGSSVNAYDELVSGIMGNYYNMRDARQIIDAEVNLGYPDSKIITYEAGQHVTTNAATLNRKDYMYELYVRYLDSLDRYVDEMSHYLHSGTFGSGGAWGSKEYIGQPLNQAHKYRALYEFAMGTATRPDSEKPVAPEEITYSALSENGYRLHWTRGVDNHKVVGYIVLVEGTEYGTTADTTLVVEGLQGGRQYGNVVLTVDSTGNQSDPGEELFITTSGAADFTVTFVVTGNDTQEPLEGASVVFDAQDATTDETGTALFSNQPSGTGLLYEVSATGYNTHNGSVDLVTIDPVVEVELSKIIGIADRSTDFRVFPNPAVDQITVQGPAPLERVTITDLTGRVMQVTDGAALNSSIDLSGLLPGAYILRIELKDGTSGRVTLIRQ